MISSILLVMASSCDHVQTLLGEAKSRDDSLLYMEYGGKKWGNQEALFIKVHAR